MPQITISPDFFRTERDRAYADWESATWRELTQNAVDQNASRIDIGLTADPINGGVNITYADNGPGMSRADLDAVYFALGATTKADDPTKIGGFGRARILTCFAMRSYQIFSQDYRAAGVGSHYEVFDSSWTDGFKLAIAVDDTDLVSMQQALMRFLYESQITARITLNGARLPSKSVNPGRHIRDLEVDGTPFARVYVNKSASVARVIVRVNGVSMFTTHTNAKAQVVVEIEPGLSRKVLTANRDGLRYCFRQSLDAFLSELAVNTNSALRTRRGLKTTVFQAGGMKAISVAKKKAATKAAHASVAPDEFQPAALYNVRVAAPTVIDGYDVYDQTAGIQQPDEFDVWLRRTFGDIFVFDEVESPAVRKVLPLYLPENWKKIETSIGNGTWVGNDWHQPSRKHRKGGNIIRVLLLWQTAIHYALEIGMELFDLETLRYAVGFVFPNDETQADCRQQNDGCIFNLCPVDANGKLKYQITDRVALKTIMAYAQHEIIHVKVTWHGEEFSSYREQMAIRFDEMECLRRMKAALRAAKI